MAKRFTLKLEGIEDVRKALKHENKKIREAMRAAVYQEGVSIMGQSVVQVPVETGRLRATHYVTLPNRDGVVEIGYGTVYALPVHERLSVNHPHGKAKFLQDPLNKARRGYIKRIAKRARDNHRRGVGVPSPVEPTRPKE